MRSTILVAAMLTLAADLAVAQQQQASAPPWSASVLNSGTPGLQGIPAFLWNQSADPKAFDERPTLRIDREVQAGSGKPGYTYKALWVLGTTGFASSGYEWTITGEQHNRSRGSTGAQNVAVNGTIWRDPTDTGEPSGPSWGLNGNCVDTTGEQPPTYGCIGAELDVGGAVGPDPHRQRVILHGAGGGKPGSHIGYGIMVSPTPGTTIDRAFSTANVNGAFGIGLDLAGGVFGGAAILMGTGQFLALDGTPEGAFEHFMFYRDRVLTYMTPGGPMLRLADDGAAHIGRIIEAMPHVPASADAPCIAGEHAWDRNFEYRCIAENRWRRAALSDW